MKYREMVIYNGQTFMVPENIVRCDDQRTHGWQVRYGDTKEAFFPDGMNKPNGSENALKKAIKELEKRIKILPAPTGIRTATHTNKVSPLPVGVSGPAMRLRKGRNAIEYGYQVSVPRYGKGSTTVKVYVGTENTATEERHAAAIEKAIAIRKEAVEKFQIEATEAKREKIK
jgi:hypothetical protein